MNLCVITDRPFWLESGGSQIRIARLLRHLAKTHQCMVAVVPGAKNDSLDVPHTWEGIPVNRMTLPIWEKLFLRAWRKAKRIACGWGWMPSRLLWVNNYGSVAEKIATLLAREQVSVVIVEYLSLLDAIRCLQRQNHRILVDTHDVFSMRQKSLADSGVSTDLPLSSEDEAELLRKFDAVIGIQRTETRVLQKMVPEMPVFTASIPAQLRPLPPAAGEGFNVCYCAADNEVNRNDIAAFIRSVWRPFLASAGSAPCLFIAGGICEPLRKVFPAEPGVRLLGFVPSLDEVYADAHLVINPARCGSGLKAKCIEGLGHRRALLTTEHGMQGMEEGEGLAFAVYRTDIEALEWLQRFVKTPEDREKFAADGFDFVEKHFSDAAAYAELDGYLLKYE